MMKRRIRLALKENRAFLLFVFLMCVFRSAIADWNDVPTGSMKPTIMEGDRVLINKMAYDIRLPFTTHSLKKLADPERGDIIVFESDVSGKRLIKRVVGIPGDTLSLSNNVLTVNGTRLDYYQLRASDLVIDAIEDLLGVSHQVRINRKASRRSSFAALTVPENYYLALGDNRDNSADSRVIGLVPRKEIVGRSRHVVFSLDYSQHFTPRKDRFFKLL